MSVLKLTSTTIQQRNGITMPTLRPTRLEKLGSTMRRVVNTNGLLLQMTKKDTTKSGLTVMMMAMVVEMRTMTNGSVIGTTVLILPILSI